MGFDIFGFHIQLYGIIISIGMIVAVLVVSHLYKKSGYDDTLIYILAILIIPLSIVGARAYFVIFYDGDIDFFAIRQGGLAILGGVIVGLIVVLVFTKFKRAGIFTLSDGIVVGVIIAQAIGRWGNFTNILDGMYEGYGQEVANHIPPFTILIDGVPHLSFWLFESVLNFGGFFVLFKLYKRQKKFGTTTAGYLIYYGTVRMILESFRGDVLTIFSDSTFFLNRVSVFVGLVMVLGGLCILMLNKYGLIGQNTTRLMARQDKNRQKDKTKQQIDDSQSRNDTIQTKDEIVYNIDDVNMQVSKDKDRDGNVEFTKNIQDSTSLDTQKNNTQLDNIESGNQIFVDKDLDTTKDILEYVDSLLESNKSNSKTSND